MHPTNSGNFAVRKPGTSAVIAALSLAAALAGRAQLLDTTGAPSSAAREVSATGVQPPVMGVRTSDITRVPLRGQPSAAKPPGAVGLTTDLTPPENPGPLMPVGAEEDTVEPPPAVDTKKRFTLTIEARAIFDDNIFLSARGSEQDDFVFLLAPTFTYRRGDVLTKQDSYFTASYSPSASFFADHDEENSIDHSFRFDGQKRFGKLAVGVEGRYQRLSGATVELSDRVDRDEYGARIRARYDLSGKTSLEAGVGRSSVRYNDRTLEDYDEWVADTYVGYQVTGRTRIAAGGAIGSLDVQGRERQDFKRAMVKVTTEATGKLTLDAKGGMEWRDTGAGQQTTPVFNVAAEYRPTARTSIGASVFREVSASGSIEGENVTRTGAAVKVQQKIGRALTASVEAGFERLKYDATEAGTVSSGREDEYFFIRPSLRYELREGRRLELYYSHREDDSSVNLYDFDADQFGLAFAYDF